MILNEIKQSRYFLLFVFLFGYAQTVQIRFLIRQKINGYLFTPEAAVVNFISACMLFAIMRFLMFRWQKSNTFSYKETLKIFGVSLVLYVAIINLLALLLAVIFNTFEKNFNPVSILHNAIADIMNVFVYGSFFLAYYYYRKNKTNQKQLAQYHQALSQTKIDQLKNQLNPHFLFNNLNVLDQLIEEDKHKASDFLNEFAEIYRYVLQATEQKLVSIEEELSFAKNYFGLIQYKYGKAYQLEIQAIKTEGTIVPLALQLLLENAVQHNLGTEKNPVSIKIEITDKLTVSNNVIEKRNSKIASGRALKNLKEQYTLLIEQQIEIIHTEQAFSVSVPIIPLQEK